MTVCRRRKHRTRNWNHGPELHGATRHRSLDCVGQTAALIEQSHSQKQRDSVMQTKQSTRSSGAKQANPIRISLRASTAKRLEMVAESAGITRSQLISVIVLLF